MSRVDVEVVVGDITTLEVDAIVTAANAELRGGGGVDGAIHRAAGPRLLAACRPLAPCPAGHAVVTPAFDLEPRVRWVVHAVGPIYRGSDDDPRLLASAYTESLRRADEVGAISIAFPSISTGVYGYPKPAAAEVSVSAVRGYDATTVRRVLLVAYDEAMADLWRSALAP